VAGVLALLVVGSFVLIGVGTDWDRIATRQVILANLLRLFPPNVAVIPDLAGATLDTVAIAVLATLLTGLMSVPVVWLSSRTISPHVTTYLAGRAIIVVSRSVHEVVWALVFVIAVGLGPLAGILALSVRGIGFVAKVVSEKVEAIDRRPIEALQAVGANVVQVVRFGILPQILPVFVGTLVFEWDLAIRRAAVIGVVGAGGLGLAFHEAMVQFKWRDATAILLILALLVITGEVVSRRLRERAR
jgi:phosphonate transport system permease protein